MAFWYRRFIKRFSTIVTPLTRLTKKHIKWRWSKEEEEAFQTLKKTLITAPVLACPDFTRPFALQTDANAYGLGAVLRTEELEELED